jgi:hypothetical protein
MKSALAFALSLLFFCAACTHQAPQVKGASASWSPDVAMQGLVGAWVVDLRGSPADAPYTQPFVVSSVDLAQRHISGSFYGSDITWSRANTAWGKLVVTFITSDGQGEYIHTTTLEGDTLVGTSTAKHRNLLVPWTARRNVN